MHSRIDCMQDFAYNFEWMLIVCFGILLLYIVYFLLSRRATPYTSRILYSNNHNLSVCICVCVSFPVDMCRNGSGRYAWSVHGEGSCYPHVWSDWCWTQRVLPRARVRPILLRPCPKRWGHYHALSTTQISCMRKSFTQLSVYESTCARMFNECTVFPAENSLVRLSGELAIKETCNWWWEGYVVCSHLWDVIWKHPPPKKDKENKKLQQFFCKSTFRNCTPK